MLATIKLPTLKQIKMESRIRKNAKWLVALVVVFVLGVSIGTFRKRNGITNASPFTDSLERTDSLWNRVRRGDTTAYLELSGRYSDYPPEEILFWAIYMANRYDYSRAYSDVYFSLMSAYDYGDSTLCKMDTATRNFALKYLYIAAQRNEEMAVGEIEDKKTNECWTKSNIMPR